MSFMLLILASCMQEEEMKQDTTFSGVLVKRTFSTTVAQDTKVSLADDNGAIQWSEGDEISIWDGVANRKFTRRLKHSISTKPKIIIPRK